MDEGFKQTEIKIIPADWDVRYIKEISIPVRGSSPRPAGSPRFFNGDFIPWLTVASLTNISVSKILVNKTDSFLTEEGSKYSRRLEKGTLIIANSGATLGVAKILGIQCCANDGIAALLELEADSSYVCYFINTLTKTLRTTIATGNGQPNLNTTLIGNIQIPIPSPVEQKAIANALRDVDDWIESLETLIEKKRLIKQGAVQELLRPKEGWVEKKLCDLVSIIKGKQFNAALLDENGLYPCYSGGITPSGYSSNFNEEQKIIISEGGNSCGYVNFIRSRFWSGGHCYTLHLNSTNNISEDFLYHALKFHQRSIMELRVGSGLPNIQKKTLSDFIVQYPDNILEQTNVATILSDMDLEIETLQQKLSKAHQIKQGMMQQLLTGKIRLIKPTIAKATKTLKRVTA